MVEVKILEVSALDDELGMGPNKYDPQGGY